MNSLSSLNCPSLCISNKENDIFLLFSGYFSRDECWINNWPYRKIYFSFFWNTSQEQDLKADSYDLKNCNSVLMFNGWGTFLAVKCYKSLIERKQQNIWGVCCQVFCGSKETGKQWPPLDSTTSLWQRATQLWSFPQNRKKSGFLIVLLILLYFVYFLISSRKK